jgi:hypothetical protein
MVSDAAGVSGNWRSIRVYLRESSHVNAVTELARQVFGPALDGVLLAELCRDDLFLEIEGVRDA